ncbi:MAG: DUF4178 domain-containing protein [Saprospiraceae bacterium]
MDKQQSLQILGIGSNFDFAGSTWEVIGAHQYNWSDDSISIEYKVKTSKEVAYLEVEFDDDTNQILLEFSAKINRRDLEPDMNIDLFNDEEVLVELKYKDEMYDLEEIYEGTCTNMFDDEDGEDLTNFSYCNEDFFVNIVLNDDDTLDFTAGEYLDLEDLTNFKNHIV